MIKNFVQLNLHSYFSSKVALQRVIIPNLKGKIRIEPARLVLKNLTRNKNENENTNLKKILSFYPAYKFKSQFRQRSIHKATSTKVGYSAAAFS